MMYSNEDASGVTPGRPESAPQRNRSFGVSSVTFLDDYDTILERSRSSRSRMSYERTSYLAIADGNSLAPYVYHINRTKSVRLSTFTALPKRRDLRRATISSRAKARASSGRGNWSR